MLALDIENLTIAFPGLSSPALAIGRLSIDAGSRVAITGASGSGKSTFVNIVAGLERTRQGRIRWNGEDIASFSENRRDRFRAANIGLVMQEFHLFPGLSALENVLLPARLAGAATADVIERAHTLLSTVGLSRPGQKIETMSRGEMQRVAIGRALLRKPGVIIADEPTASLDAESGEAVGDLLLDLAIAEGSTLIVVSHDQRLASRLDRRITFGSGRISEDSASTAGEAA
ncbi:ATP-binding cassette domain-containing protein [Rhizobium ruizarguesonis]|uniref:ABC transporter ATP-binding protein n=1 Tax=Rhizobium ruizarguesonis TaxID=2081791 RepID=UPI00103170F5|nr:ATP-binding cassette domain-containing protein [Rhizobium ruizarguesonis]QIJ42747.1 ATP-binding cassette domain-containing protein [Rhizobium leguminosarum]NEH30485.1 ATP-binding cassette domain-containing protein [Rhizobium ruizarguesonis]NEJ04711.1 ATP-binding cassette domain-containing protein [Rhizobium ruizarguesonis]NEK09392.1 ATP-binding cassette domain-containing protein [Rhizobium ruizarguesonis]TAU12226.1 ATP-binding cassette domain-containing protein [Rhizobium ruizarguesonis]